MGASGSVSCRDFEHQGSCSCARVGVRAICPRVPPEPKSLLPCPTRHIAVHAQLGRVQGFASVASIASCASAPRGIPSSVVHGVGAALGSILAASRACTDLSSLMSFRSQSGVPTQMHGNVRSRPMRMACLASALLCA